MEAEEVLTGGNVADRVVKIGATVRKPALDHTAGVEAVLDHLAVAPCSGDLVFSEMSEYLGDGPLTGCGSGSEPVYGNVVDEFGQESGGLRLGGKWVFALRLFADAG